MLFNISEACSTAQVQQVQSHLRNYAAAGLVDLSRQTIGAEIAGRPCEFRFTHRRSVHRVQYRWQALRLCGDP